jgi:drug/metabolite transporter (DMT)-like permease
MRGAAAARRAALLPPGVRYMLGSAFFFSLMSLLVKLAGRGLPSQEIVLVRGVISLTLSYWLVRRARVALWGKRPWILVLRGLLGFGALSCFYFALTRLPIAETTVLHYTNPIWTALFAALLLGERLTPRVALPILASFGGVALVARPAFLFGQSAAQLDLVGVGAALLGAVFSAGAYVAVREASRTEHPLVIVFYFPLVTVPASLPFAANFVWPDRWEWLVLLGVGVSTQIAQVYLTRGLSLEPAARATTMGYTQIIFVSLWGIIFFGEYLDALSALGCLLIVAGTLVVAIAGPAGARGALDSERPAPIAADVAGSARGAAH